MYAEAWEKEKVSIVGDTGKGEGEKRSLGNLSLFQVFGLSPRFFLLATLCASFRVATPLCEWKPQLRRERGSTCVHKKKQSWGFVNFFNRMYNLCIIYTIIIFMKPH